MCLIFQRPDLFAMLLMCFILSVCFILSLAFAIGGAIGSLMFSTICDNISTSATATINASGYVSNGIEFPFLMSSQLDTFSDLLSKVVERERIDDEVANVTGVFLKHSILMAHNLTAQTSLGTSLVPVLPLCPC